MKRTWALLLCAAMLFSCLAGCGKKEEVVDHTVKIGLFEPMSGDQALYGNWERLGVEYARTVRQSAVVNGVPHTVELVEKDTRSRIDGSVYAARALAEEGVSIALGTYGSSECSVAAPALEEAGISVIGITCTDPTVTTGHANYYRVCYTDEYQAMLLADYAYEYGARVAYCLAQTDRDYDRAMCNAFIKEFQALGGSVITTVTTILYNTYSTSLNNFADYLYGAVTNKADVLFAPIPPRKGAQLIGECAASDVRFSVLGDVNWDTPAIAEAARETYMYVSCASIFPTDRNEETLAFTQGFQDWLNADERRIEANGGDDTVHSASALAYDAYMMAVAAIEAANSTEPAAVSAAVGGVSVHGVTGDLAFDSVGDVQRSDLYLKHADTFTGTFRFEKAQVARRAADTALTPTA
ncbi:MAG: ABC transporter substrate-binding protein [bacterium]|nr:ABC transporter substrate-binding protein [bacterium]